jgi:hypothetical protein
VQNKYDEIIQSNKVLTIENAELKKERREFVHKIFQMEADNDIINLNPYEMHKKIRLYETKFEEV